MHTHTHAHTHTHTQTHARMHEGLEKITNALAGNQSLPLERLELSGIFTFTDTAAYCLTQFISNTTTLQYLIIEWDCTFSAHGLLQLAMTIHDNSTLQEKSLRHLQSVQTCLKQVKN